MSTTKTTREIAAAVTAAGIEVRPIGSIPDLRVRGLGDLRRQMLAALTTRFDPVATQEVRAAARDLLAVLTPAREQLRRQMVEAGYAITDEDELIVATPAGDEYRIVTAERLASLTRVEVVLAELAAI